MRVHLRALPAARVGAAPAPDRPRRPHPLVRGTEDRASLDIDSLLRPVYGHQKQGASYGHAKISGRTVLRKGLNPLVTTLSTAQAAPVVAQMRLRAGKTGSGRGAASQLRSAITTARACEVVEFDSAPQSSGVRTELKIVAGAPHVYDLISPDCSATVAALARRCPRRPCRRSCSTFHRGTRSRGIPDNRRHLTRSPDRRTAGSVGHDSPGSGHHPDADCSST